MTNAQGNSTHALGRRMSDVNAVTIVTRLARVAHLLYRRSMADDLPAMASALAYKTLLGLIPILIVVTLVAKTLMGAQFAPFVAGFIGSLGLDNMRIVPPTDSASTSGGAVALGTWVETLVTQASEIDLSALGWVGVSVTILSAIWLMTSIELSFNRVFRARQGRTWMRRFVLYWFVLTASPLLIAAIPLLSSVLHGAGTTAGLGWIIALLGTVWNVAVLWALLLIIYMVVPAARVRPQCAAIGAFCASVVIIGLKGMLSAYFEHAFGMSRLYGSLGLVPVFMFWMWVVWVTVLGGLQVAAFAQTIRARGLDAGSGADDDAHADPMLVLAVMEQASTSWRAGRPVTRDSIAAELHMDDRLSAELLEELVRGGFLLHTDRDAYAPTRPPEDIRPDDVLKAAFAHCAGEEGVERSRIATALRAAQLETASKMRIAEVRADRTTR
ncbi:MAG: YihY/virulence factor BrkB family protein [Planctomycetota bacterium]